MNKVADYLAKRALGADPEIHIVEGLDANIQSLLLQDLGSTMVEVN